MYQRFIFLLLVIFFTACQSVSVEDTSNNTLILSLSRGPCFGRCAVFSLKIWDNGYTVFEGEENVLREGLVGFYLSDFELKNIEAILSHVDFYSLDEAYIDGNDNCKNFMTDHPVFVLSATNIQNSHTITVNTGCSLINEDILSLPTRLLLASRAKQYAY